MYFQNQLSFEKHANRYAKNSNDKMRNDHKILLICNADLRGIAECIEMADSSQVFCKVDFSKSIDVLGDLFGEADRLHWLALPKMLYLLHLPYCRVQRIEHSRSFSTISPFLLELVLQCFAEEISQIHVKFFDVGMEMHVCYT